MLQQMTKKDYGVNKNSVTMTVATVERILWQLKTNLQ